MKIQIICVAYERPIPLRVLIDSFILQTNPNWVLHIIYDGFPPQEIIDIIHSFENAKRSFEINFTWSDAHNGNFGHPNRKKMLYELHGDQDDFILMTNDDNYYVPTFVEQMLRKAEEKNIGIVSCNTVHSHFGHSLHESTLVEYGIDMGAFIVRYDIAKTVGFNFTDFTADGKYARQCADFCEQNAIGTSHIPRPLFIHN